MYNKEYVKNTIQITHLKLDNSKICIVRTMYKELLQCVLENTSYSMKFTYTNYIYGNFTQYYY